MLKTSPVARCHRPTATRKRCGAYSSHIPTSHTLQLSRRVAPGRLAEAAAAISVDASMLPEQVSQWEGKELDDDFSQINDGSGLMTVAGFGSLLSERSARTTFPDLQNFRPGRLQGYRRVFAHTADIFFARGIAKPETGEISSLSVEPCPGHELVVSLFEVPYTPASVKAFIAREHEFRIIAVRPYTLEGQPRESLAVLCARYTDEEYKARRCPPDEWQRRWAVHGINRVWRDDVLPCRVYLRHCVLAARSFCPEAADSFLDETYLADRTTTIRQYLEQRPEILEELPPPELMGRYSG